MFHIQFSFCFFQKTFNAPKYAVKAFFFLFFVKGFNCACSIINWSIFTIRGCTNYLAYFQSSVSFVAFTHPVGLSCEEHTSGYKLWMFPFTNLVNQQCMKQPHLLHRLLLFSITHTCGPVMWIHFGMYWFGMRSEGSCCLEVASLEKKQTVFSLQNHTNKKYYLKISVASARIRGKQIFWDDLTHSSVAGWSSGSVKNHHCNLATPLIV